MTEGVLPLFHVDSKFGRENVIIIDRDDSCYVSAVRVHRVDVSVNEVDQVVI